MKDALRPLVLATQLGATMGLITVGGALVGLFLGARVDLQLGLGPVATPILALVGVSVGWMGAVNLAMSAVRRFRAPGMQLAQVRTAFTLPELGRALALVAGLLAISLLSIGSGLALGRWLDGISGRGPLFTVALLLVALIDSIVGGYKFARRVGGHASRASGR